MDLERKTGRLKELLSRHHRLLVAYSGGVDSAFLLWFAHQVPGIEVQGILADSPSLKRRELERATTFAEVHGLPLRIIGTKEVENPDYRSNPLNRCYFCKHELFTRMNALAASESWDAITYGENADDIGEDRPGRQAAGELSILSPLREAGLAKADIRELSRRAGLEVSEKAAQPCLASRIPHGQEVTEEKLRQVEQAESLLEDLGFRIARVRHQGSKAFVQVSPAETPRLMETSIQEKLATGLRKAGFEEIACDPVGYQGAALK